MIDLDYGLEYSIPIKKGTLRFPNYEEEPNGVSYVRVVDPEGREISYWACDEWRDAPEEVMGAILNTLIQRVPNREEDHE